MGPRPPLRPGRGWWGRQGDGCRHDPVDTRPPVFISYARADAEAFAAHLCDALQSAGVSVWWDRARMESRGLAFLQELQEAIRGCARLIVVMSPAPPASPYVRLEWEHALLAGRVITPVLLAGEVADYAGRVAVGAEHGLPEALTRLADALLGDLARPCVITAVEQTAAVQGMGGVGKTVLATAFARSTPVRRAFPDGIFWLTMPVDDSDGAALTALRALASTLGAQLAPDADPAAAANTLARALAPRRCLLVLDDLWHARTAVLLRDAAGPAVRLLVTTRIAALAFDLGAQSETLDVLSPELARALLARWMDVATQALPHYDHPNLARALAVSVYALEPLARAAYEALAVFAPREPIPESAINVLLGADGWAQGDVADFVDSLLGGSLARRAGPAAIRLHDLQHAYLAGVCPDLPALHRRLVEAYRALCREGWHTAPEDGHCALHLAGHLRAAGSFEECAALASDVRWLQAKLDALRGSQRAVTAASWIGDVEPALPPAHGDALHQFADQALHALRLGAPVATQVLARLPSEERMLAPLRADAVRHAPVLEPLRPSVWLDRGPRRIITVDGDATVEMALLEPEGHVVVGTLAAYRNIAVMDLATGERLAVLSDLDIRLQDAYNGEAGIVALAVTGGHRRLLTCAEHEWHAVAVDRAARYAVAGDAEGRLAVYDLSEGRLVAQTAAHSHWVEAIAIEPVSGLVVSSSWGDGEPTARLWRWPGLEPAGALEAPGGTAKFLVPTRGGAHLLSATKDVVALWDLDARRCVAEQRQNGASFTGVAMARDGSVFTCDLDRTLRRWDMASAATDLASAPRATAAPAPSHTSPVYALAVSPDGRWIASAGTEDVEVQLCDGGGMPVCRLQGHGAARLALAWLPDGHTLASAGSDGRLIGWDTTTAAQRWCLHTDLEGITEVLAFTAARGACVAVGNWTGRLVILEVATGARVDSIQASEPIRSLALALGPGPGQLLIGTKDAFKLWTVLPSARLAKVPVGVGVDNDEHFVVGIAALADGRVLCASTEGGLYRMPALPWPHDEDLALDDEARLDQVPVAWPHPTAVTASANGRIAIVATRRSKSIVVYDTRAELQRISEFHGDSDMLACACSADATVIAAADSAGQVHVLRLNRDGNDFLQ